MHEGEVLNPNIVRFSVKLLKTYLAYKSMTPAQPSVVRIESSMGSALTEVKDKDGAVIVVLGTRGTGKTELCYRVAEFFGKPAYAVSPEQKPRPSFITPVNFVDFEERVPVGSTLIMDDLPVYASSQDYAEDSVQRLNRIIPMVRHERKWHLIFSTQSSAQSDRYILDCDMALFKPLGLLTGDMERPNIRRIYKEFVDPEFYNKDSDWVKRHAYLMTPTYRGVIEVGMVT